MPPAWQARASQQQEFVWKFLLEVFEAADRDDGPALIDVTVDILLCLKKRSYDRGEQRLGSDKAHQLVQLFLQRATEFARVPTEVDYLLCQLFQQVQHSALTPYYGAWSRDQLLDPQRTLGARYGNEEVKLEE